MTRTEAVKEFFKKAVLPVAIAGLLYCIFKSACIRNGELDLLWLWIGRHGEPVQECARPVHIHPPSTFKQARRLAITNRYVFSIPYPA